MSDANAFQELRQRLMQLYGEKQHAAALELVEQASDSFPDQQPRIVFWRMCLLSLCNRPQDVLSAFQQGLDSGLWWAASQFNDPDLDAVRALPEFKRLVQISDKKTRAARAQIKPDRAVLVPEKAEPPLPLLIALHGRSVDKQARLESWQAARERGWLVLAPQSTQPLYSGSYCWDDPAQGVKDIRSHWDDIAKTYPIDRERLILAGFSQGAGMALYAALSGQIPVRGFIGVGTYWEDPKQLEALASGGKNLRAYFVVGEKDGALGRTREIRAILHEAGIQYYEEMHPGMGHEFPADFGATLDRALKFIFGKSSE